MYKMRCSKFRLCASSNYLYVMVRSVRIAGLGAKTYPTLEGRQYGKLISSLLMLSRVFRNELTLRAVPRMLMGDGSLLEPAVALSRHQKLFPLINKHGQSSLSSRLGIVDPWHTTTGSMRLPGC